MRELIVVRHGQSLYNLHLTDHLDSSLTEEGVRQVRETGKFLASHLGHLHEFVGRCSPYLRCLQTARILKEEAGLEFWVDAGPREVMIQYEKTHVLPHQTDFPDFNWTDLPPEGWIFHHENEDEFNQRLVSYYKYLDENFQKVFVISHGTTSTTLAKMSVGNYDGSAGIKAGTYVDNSSISYMRHGELVWFNKVIYGDPGPQMDYPSQFSMAI